MVDDFCSNRRRGINKWHATGSGYVHIILDNSYLTGLLVKMQDVTNDINKIKRQSLPIVAAAVVDPESA